MSRAQVSTKRLLLYNYIKGWGGQWWKIFFFSMYRPSCLIEAYVRPEKYWLVWDGPLANQPFNFNFIFLSNGLMVTAERAACFADIFHGMDGRRAAGLA